ncbi:MAG TPA: ABC transporter permease [Acidimicrobiia bacterium]|nr:ABC transporter permease [Acidimicrobiia bacterium]
MKVLAIAQANVLRMLRDKSSIFFVFIFPLALILLIGLQFGGSFTPKLGVVASSDGPETERLLERLTTEPRLEVVRYQGEESLVTAVERGTVAAALVISADYDRQLQEGEVATLGYVARPDGSGASLQVVVAEAVAAASKELSAARFLVREGLTDAGSAAALVAQVAPSLTPIEVTTRTVGDRLFPPTLGRFDLGAQSQLILFMFVTALSGAAVLIQTRQLGLSRRMLTTPTEIGTIVVGEGLGRFGVVLVQGIYIMVATLLVFGVDWGDPLGAVAVLVVFAAVGAGAAMLMGAVFANAEQAGGVGVMAGLGLAALGGCMLPLELFSPTLRRVAHITPHAWAVDAFSDLVQRGGTLIDILPELAVLALYAAVLLTLASWRLRAAITR